MPIVSCRAELRDVESIFSLKRVDIVLVKVFGLDAWVYGGSGPSSLDLLPRVSDVLSCICGTSDHLILADHIPAVREGLHAVDPDGERLRYIEMSGADNGFMWEERSSFNTQASGQGWMLLLES